ncbi:MAG: hypothetical protein ACTHOF_17650, partial [Flavisolibacter sp.]
KSISFMPALQLMRTDERTNQKAEMVLFLNGKQLGTIGNGEKKDFNIPAGFHKLSCRIDSSGSKNFSFQLKEGEVKTLVLSNNNDVNKFGPFGSGAIAIDLIVNGLLLVYYFVIGHNRYISIKELKGF